MDQDYFHPDRIDEIGGNWAKERSLPGVVEYIFLCGQGYFPAKTTH
jgi:hypothetical protein